MRMSDDDLKQQLAQIAEKVSRVETTLLGNPDSRGLKAMVLDLWEDRQRRRKWWSAVKASVVVSAIAAVGAWLKTKLHINFH